MVHPNCDVCGGSIEHQSKALELKIGPYDKAESIFGSKKTRIKTPRSRAYAHIDCLVDEVAENDDLDDGQKLKQLLKKISDFSINTGEGENE
jgi:hypothetical protein